MNEILKEVIMSVITIMITILSGCITRIITIKMNDMSNKIKDSRKVEFLNWVNSVIVQCVDTTTQTYIDTLKKNGNFNEQAQKEAFNMTMNNISSLLSEQDMSTLGGYVGDTSTWITTSIESYIKSRKEGSDG
jgi:Ni,Fe-hydrogenase I large subunit